MGIIVAFGVYLRFVAQGPLGVDSWWHDAVEVHRGTVPYAVAVFMADVGNGVGAATFAAIAAALLFVLRRPRSAAVVLSAMVFGVVASEVIKFLVARPRPWDQLYSPGGSSYPSGHTMGAAALATSIALVVIYSGWVTKRQASWVIAAAVAWVVLMAWSRTALHVHWLSDTFAGALLGSVAAIAAFALWRPETSHE